MNALGLEGKGFVPFDGVFKLEGLATLSFGDGAVVLATLGLDANGEGKGLFVPLEGVCKLEEGLAALALGEGTELFTGLGACCPPLGLALPGGGDGAV